MHLLSMLNKATALEVPIRSETTGETLINEYSILTNLLLLVTEEHHIPTKTG